MANSDVAVVILNYMSWQDTLAEIELCHERLHICYSDMIVVDNASPNESAEELMKAAKERFVFLKSEENRGYAAGNNIGLRYAYAKGYKYAWILNNDIYFEDECLLDKILHVFKEDGDVAVVNPDIYAPDGYLYNRDAIRPDFFDYTIGMWSYRKKGRNVQDMGGYGYVYRPQGCCMIVDLKKLQQIDFLDEHTFLYVEEPILAERLRVKDYKCACCLLTSVVHNHSKTVKKCFASKEVSRMNTQSFSYYLKTYRGYGKWKTLVCGAFNYVKQLVT